jgi:photosystem II stability/assembly factor-like uncharacterized protein
MVAAALLAIASVSVLLMARQALHPAPVGPGPAGHARTTPTPLPTPPQPMRGVLVAPPNPIVLPGSAQLSVPSSEVVWVLMDDQYLYRSTDRGTTWVQRPMPPAKALPLPEISFVNGVEGWLSTGGYVSDCSANHTDIWHTTDGGSTWALLGSRGIEASRCKQGLSFVDALHGFLGAWDESHAPLIYRTSDGGMTWSASQPLPDPPGITHGAGATVHTGLVQEFGSTLLVPDYGNNGTTSIQTVFHSTDGGATWIYLATAPQSAGDLAFVSTSRWLQLIAPGQSIETTDSGATWHSSASDYSQAAPIAPQIVFGDTMVGYATVRGEIRRTVDGGLHWTDIKTPGT